MSASWPTSIATDATLYVAVNELQNNLSGAINNSVTTIGLNSTTSFPTVGLVLIDNEIIKYTGVSGNNLTGCTRAFDGTTAASHSSAAIVSFAFCAAHHNNLKDEVIAVETSLNFTASKAISSDTNGRLAVATTTLAELNFVSGVTSAIQTQLNLKAPLASPTFTGTITTPLTASRVVTSNGSSQLAVSTATTTEIDFVSGVTSAIQTQLNAKLTSPTCASFTPTIAGMGTVGSNTGFYIQLGKLLIVWGSFLSGTTAASTVSITIPTGTLDTSKLSASSAARVGTVREINNPTVSIYDLFSDGSDTTHVFVSHVGTAGSGYTKENGSSLFDSATIISYNFIVPIS